MFCSKCGAQIAPNGSFCPRCGEPVRQAQRNYQPPVQQAYTPQQYNPQYVQPQYQAQPQKVRTVADKVIMIILMVLSALNAAIPAFDWIKIPVIEDFTLFIGNISYVGGKNAFTFIKFLDDLFKGYTLSLVNSGMYFQEIELIGALIIAFRVLAIIMIVAMVLTLVMVILGLCFQYKPACVFSMISAILMFIASLCYVILMGVLSLGSGLAQMTAWPLISIALSFVNVIITIVAIVITTKARNKKRAARLG